MRDAVAVFRKQVTVDLAGTKAATIRHIRVSSMLRSGVVALPALTNVSQNRFTALRQFEVWACNAEKDDCSTSAGLDHVYTSRGEQGKAETLGTTKRGRQLAGPVYVPR